MVTVKLEEDHPRNQGLSLPETQPPAWEIFRQQFRHFCYQDSPGPRLALSQLHPALPSVAQTRDTHQGDPGPAGAGAVLSILPQEFQVPVREHHPESGEEAVTILENLERKRNVHIGRDKCDVVVGNWEQNFLKCGSSENSGKT